MTSIISEIGSDMSKFPDEHHFSSWLGLTGNKNISGGKPIRGPKRKVKSRVAGVLRMGATSLLNSDSYLGARYRYSAPHNEGSRNSRDSHGPPSCAIGLPVTHQRRCVGRPGGGPLRAEARATRHHRAPDQSAVQGIPTRTDRPDHLVSRMNSTAACNPAGWLRDHLHPRLAPMAPPP